MRAMFQESVERLFADAVDAETLRLAETGAWSDSLWAQMEALGLPLAAVSEDLGGIGASWTDLFPVIRACGSSAVPAPLPETLVANALLSACGIAPPESGVTVFAAGDAVSVLRGLPWGRQARWLVLHDTTRGRLGLHDMTGAAVEHDVNVAGEPRDTVILASGSLVSDAAFDGPPDTVRLSGALIRSAQIAGALGRLTEMSAQYANERVQFGRPIGKFQAVQQQLALLATQAAAAGAVAEAAFMQARRTPHFATTASAKAVAGEAAGRGAAIAHAVHGALGFTHEHSLHFLTRRLWAWRTEYGSDARWSERLGRLIADAGEDGLWPFITETLKERPQP